MSGSGHAKEGCVACLWGAENKRLEPDSYEFIQENCIISDSISWKGDGEQRSATLQYRSFRSLQYRSSLAALALALIAAILWALRKTRHQAWPLTVLLAALAHGFVSCELGSERLPLVFLHLGRAASEPLRGDINESIISRHFLLELEFDEFDCLGLAAIETSSAVFCRSE